MIDPAYTRSFLHHEHQDYIWIRDDPHESAGGNKPKLH